MGRIQRLGPEIGYFQRYIEADGQPALDVACGTGRLLVPYLRAGLDVDGCDISTDMLALWRERAEREGLTPNLHAQAMHELDLPLWRYWLEEERRGLPEPWRPPGERRRASDGTEYELRSRVVELDPLEQSVTLEMRADMWRDGQHLAEEEHVLKMVLYFTNEVLLLLERAGFGDVVLRGDYTDKEPTAVSDFVVFIARKPGVRR